MAWILHWTHAVLRIWTYAMLIQNYRFFLKSHFTYIYKCMHYKLNWFSKHIHAVVCFLLFPVCLIYVCGGNNLNHLAVKVFTPGVNCTCRFILEDPFLKVQVPRRKGFLESSYIICRTLCTIAVCVMLSSMISLFENQTKSSWMILKTLEMIVTWIIEYYMLLILVFVLSNVMLLSFLFNENMFHYVCGSVWCFWSPELPR
jgi:hypothetical protein